MKHGIMSVALLALLIAGGGCDRKAEQAFHPSPPQVSIDYAAYDLDTVRDGYRTFDSVRPYAAKIEADDRYQPLIEKAEQSVSHSCWR